MILKMIVGRSLRGVDNYINRVAARPQLISTTMAGATPRERAVEFRGLRSARPRLGRAAAHLILAHSPGDRALSADEWSRAVAIALAAHSASDAAFVAVRHPPDEDHKHDHVHIALCRVLPGGGVVSDSLSYSANERAARCIERELGLSAPAPRPPERRVARRSAVDNATRRATRRGTKPAIGAQREQPRQLVDVLRDALRVAVGEDDLFQRLRSAGVEAVRAGGGWKVRCAGADEWLKSTTLDRALAWRSVVQALRANASAESERAGAASGVVVAEAPAVDRGAHGAQVAPQAAPAPMPEPEPDRIASATAAKRAKDPAVQVHPPTAQPQPARAHAAGAAAAPQHARERGRGDFHGDLPPGFAAELQAELQAEIARAGFSERELRGLERVACGLASVDDAARPRHLLGADEAAPRLDPSLAAAIIERVLALLRRLANLVRRFLSARGLELPPAAASGAVATAVRSELDRRAREAPRRAPALAAEAKAIAAERDALAGELHDVAIARRAPAIARHAAVVAASTAGVTEAREALARANADLERLEANPPAGLLARLRGERERHARELKAARGRVQAAREALNEALRAAQEAEPPLRADRDAELGATLARLTRELDYLSERLARLETERASAAATAAPVLHADDADERARAAAQVARDRG